MDRKVVIDTDRRDGELYKVTESGGRFTAYKVSVGLFWDDTTKIGEARSLEDAITIIKAHAEGTVRRVKVDWW